MLIKETNDIPSERSTMSKDGCARPFLVWATHKKECGEKVEMATAFDLVSTSHENGKQGKLFLHCIFCEGRHASQDCFSAKKMLLDNKRNNLLKRDACFSCQKLGHTYRFSKFGPKYNICDKNHYISMCPVVMIMTLYIAILY